MAEESSSEISEALEPTAQKIAAEAVRRKPQEKPGGLRGFVETISKSPVGVAAEMGAVAGAAVTGAHVVAEKVNAAPPSIEVSTQEPTPNISQTQIEVARATGTALAGQVQEAAALATIQAANKKEEEKLNALRGTPIPSSTIVVQEQATRNPARQTAVAERGAQLRATDVALAQRDNERTMQQAVEATVQTIRRGNSEQSRQQLPSTPREENRGGPPVLAWLGGILGIVITGGVGWGIWQLRRRVIRPLLVRIGLEEPTREEDTDHGGGRGGGIGGGGRPPDSPLGAIGR